MKNIPASSIRRVPVAPLNINIPSIRLMTKSLPQSKWTTMRSPFPNTFCREHTEMAGEKPVRMFSFYLPGEIVEFKDGSKYVVHYDRSLRRIDRDVEEKI